MVNTISFSTASLFALAFVSNVAALPTNDLPEVIPGPGLPTLGELGLTSDELFKGFSKLCT